MQYDNSARVVYEDGSGERQQEDFDLPPVRVDLIGKGLIMSIQDNGKRMIVPLDRLIAVFMRPGARRGD